MKPDLTIMIAAAAEPLRMPGYGHGLRRELGPGWFGADLRGPDTDFF
jgi:hypothetical protein